MRYVKKLWKKLAGLAVLQAAIISLLFLPIESKAVRVDMPRSTPGFSFEDFIGIVIAVGMLIGVAVFIFLIFSPVWIAIWLVRKQRSMDRGQTTPP